MKSVIEIKRGMKKEGSKNLFILSDFDRTLTYGSVKGLKTPSIACLLRKRNYLSKEYTEESRALFNKYHPAEIDPEMPTDEKKRKIGEWRKLHSELLVRSGLSKKDLQAVIKKEEIGLREGVLEFLDLLYKKEIPLVVFSASSCGELIELFFAKENRNYSNIHYVINRFNWDEGGKAVSVRDPVIHAMNKDEIPLSYFPSLQKAIKNKSNAMLLGDNLGDIGLAKGFNCKNLLKIGFFNSDYNKNKEDYEKSFHIVLQGGSDFGFINNLIVNPK